MKQVFIENEGSHSLLGVLMAQVGLGWGPNPTLEWARLDSSQIKNKKWIEILLYFIIQIQINKVII